MVRVVEVAECDGLCRAGLGAGRDVFVFLKLSAVLGIGLFFGPHEPVVTERTFFDYTPHPGGDLGRQIAIEAFDFWKVCVPPVEIPGLVRTGSLAVSAPDASGVDLTHDPVVMVYPCGCCNAHGNA